jgi:plasmid stability protein
MSKMIQVRNVPDRLHRELKRRAARRGQTLTDYVQSLLEHEVSRPPLDELSEEIARTPPVRLGRPVADLLRDERDDRNAG